MKTPTLMAALVSIALTSTWTVRAEDAYLESDGTQAVNLGCYASENTKIVIDFKILETGKSLVIFGPYSVGSGVASGLWLNGNGGLEPKLGNKWGGSFSGIKDLTVRRRVVWDAPTKKVYLYDIGSETPIGTKDCSASTATGTADRPLSLFATPGAATGESYSGNSKCRIYSMQVYENGELKHDFWPALKGGVEGFYDKVTGQLVTDAQHALDYGGDIPTIEDDPYVSTPDGGVKVDTGYICTSDTRVECDYAMLSTANDQYIFTCAGTFCLRGYLGTSEGKVEVVQKWGCASNSSTKILARQNVRHTLTIDPYTDVMTLTTGGATNFTRKVSEVRGSITGSATGTLLIGSHHGGDYASCYAKMRLYGFRIYEKGVLKHDYVPRKSEGVGILKDRVTGKVIYSCKAAQLAYGGAVREDPYVATEGGQLVLLDYYPNAKTVVSVDYRVYPTGASRNMFGTKSASASAGGFMYWVNATPGQEFYAHAAWSGGMGAPIDGTRYQAVVDQPAHTVFVLTGGSVKSSTDLSKKSGYTEKVVTSTSKLGIFNREGKATTEGAKMRVYGVYIFEDGNLVRRYEPYIKDGVVGFKDACTGGFVTTSINTGKELGLTYGGEVDYEGTADAYLESDGTQYINTGFTNTLNTRIEVDFALCTTNLRQAVFGSYDGQPRMALWRNGSSAAAEFNHRGWTGTGKVMTLERHRAITDGPAKKSFYWTGDDVKEVAAGTAADALDSRCSVGLFGWSIVKSPGYSNLGKYRIYSARIYESDALIHEYLPYKNGNTVGFYDTVTGEIKVNSAANANPFKIGGKGVDDKGSYFEVAPQDCTVPINETKTLKAFAPGAVSYIWAKDGEVLSGETSASLTVPWQRRPQQNVYTVTPVYEVYGATEKGTPVSATVTYARMGLVLLVR